MVEGAVRLLGKQPVRGARALRKAIRRGSRPEALFDLALSCLARGRPEEAAGALVELLEQDVNRPEVLLLLARAQEAAGNGGGRTSALTAARSGHPTSALVAIALARALVDGGEPDRSIPLLEEASRALAAGPGALESSVWGLLAGLRRSPSDDGAGRVVIGIGRDHYGDESAVDILDQLVDREIAEP
jgi:predicted Zn-dependent protease